MTQPSETQMNDEVVELLRECREYLMSWSICKEGNRCKDIVNRIDALLAQPKATPIGWIATSPSGRVIHFSTYDGWKVDEVMTAPPLTQPNTAPGTTADTSIVYSPHRLQSSAVSMLPHVKAGKLRAIAMTGAKRSQAIPDIPTVAEAGVPGYETGSWYGIVAPAKTPRPVIERLSREIATATRSAEISGRLVDEAVIPIGSTAEEFDAHIRRELARWAKVIAKARISED